jgi:hypothetical protein
VFFDRLAGTLIAGEHPAATNLLSSIAFNQAGLVFEERIPPSVEPTNPEMSPAIFCVLNGLLDTSIHKFFLYAFFHTICWAMQIYTPWTFIAFHSYKKYNP